MVTLPGYSTEMAFSPDGKRLRFTLKTLRNNNCSSIWEVRADGTDLHPVLPDWRGSCSSLAGGWSPDGQYYFFTSYRASSGCSIWTMGEPKGLFHRHASPPMQLTAGPMAVYFNGISPNGKTIFVGRWRGTGEIVRYDNQSHQFMPFLRGLSEADQPDFSWDGKWVTYVSERSVWRSRVDGTERLQLTPASSMPFLPRWSPDGTQIAYVDGSSDPHWKIFLISANGGTLWEMLAENEHQLDPSWSPDGKRIVFGRIPWLKGDAETIALQILDLDSRKVSKVPDSENMFAPRWSPDGRHLAAVSANGKKLLLFDFRTEKWTDWIDEPGTISYPTWSQDGTYLYYDNISVKTSGYRRAKVGQTRSEFLIDLRDLHRGGPFPLSPLGPWSGIAPDGSPLFTRNLNTDEIYSLDLELP